MRRQERGWLRKQGFSLGAGRDKGRRMEIESRKGGEGGFVYDYTGRA